MDRNLHSIIKAEYERRKKAAHDALEGKRAKVFGRIPEMEELERQIQKCGLQYNKMILSGEAPSESIMKELGSRMGSLKNRREWLLAEAGYLPDYLDIEYKCPVCKDTGYIEAEGGAAERCSCYKQQLIDLLYDQSNLKLVQNENFSFFNESYFPDVINESKYGITVSPRQNIVKIRERGLRFVENFDNPDEKNLFFIGPTGVGKTFMSNCIAMEIMAKGRTVLYETAPRLFDIISEYKMKSYKDEEYEDAGYKNIFEVELLIIDDLGTEPQSAARYAELLNILNARQTSNLIRPCKTLISTNAEIKELYELYKERVVSRIIGCFDIYKFAGEDIRTLKKLSRA